MTVRPTGPPRAPAASVAPGVGSERSADGYAGVFWTAFRRSANAMFVVELDRRIMAVNQAGTALAGRSEEALMGERMTMLLDNPAEAPDDATWRAQVLRGESFGRRLIRRPDGSTRVIEYAMRATEASGGVLVLGVCVRERPGGRPDQPQDPRPLTPREREILHLIAIGKVTAEI